MDSEAFLTVQAWLELKKGMGNQVPMDLTVRQAVEALMAAWWDDVLTGMQQDLAQRGIRWQYGEDGITAAEYVKRHALGLVDEP